MGKAAATERALRRVIRLFHSRAPEAQPLIDLLSAGGYEVYYPGEREPSPYSKIRTLNPHAVVFDMTRLPSHARYIGAEIRAHKGIRHIPLVFVDTGEAALEQTRTMFPDATFTTRGKLLASLEKVKPLADPAAPPVLGRGRPTALKLGMKAGMQVAVFDPPAGYAKLLGALPEGVGLVEEPAESLPMTLWFVQDPEEYRAGLRRMRRWAEKGRVWVVYPKGNKTPLTQFTVRESALAMGLVDYKVCSVDATWTGLAFAVKK
ncbi:MAG: hypothetical protein RL328_2312 [Acidobacteriota bacterium]|jgi:hypothetical protein